MTELASEAPWLKSKQIGWEPQIYNFDLPLYMRVFAVAMARCAPNLHHNLEPGELGKLLGQPNADGTLQPVAKQNVRNAINRAIELKFLHDSSSSLCLVLSSETTDCQLPGWRKPCAYHTGQASKPKKNFVRRTARSEAETGAYVRTKREAASSQVGDVRVMSSALPGNDLSITHGSKVMSAALPDRSPTPGSRDVLGIKPASRPNAKLGAITLDQQERPPTGQTEPITGHATCYGCREFGTEACIKHGQHFKNLQNSRQLQTTGV